MQNRTSIMFCLALFTACGGGSSTPVDAAADVDAFESDCGFPGDQGDELGIGQFCEVLSDCAGTTGAPLCSSFGDPSTHFCTKTCQMGSIDQCGTSGANMCTCNANNQCGCTPSVCLN
jgi:hypothetical protein